MDTTQNANLQTAEALTAEAINSALKILQGQFQTIQTPALAEPTDHSGDCDPDEDSAGSIGSGNFDQWMAEHAVLENGSINTGSLESMWPASFSNKYEDDDEYLAEDKHNSTNINDAWVRAREQWNSGETTQDDVISIGSSSAEEEEEDEGEGEEEEVDIGDSGLVEADMAMPLSTGGALEGFGQLVEMQMLGRALAHTVHEQEDAAEAMLSLIQPVGPSPPMGMAAEPAEPDTRSVEPSILPTEPADTQSIEAGDHASLDEMRRAIDESIERSKRIVDELTGNDDMPETEEPEEEQEPEGAEEDVSEEPSIDELKAQIFMLNGEIQQLESDKTELTRFVKELESENETWAQAVDELESHSKEIKKQKAEHATLKQRMHVVAAKVQSLTAGLEAVNAKLRESEQARHEISADRDKIFGQCRELEKEVKRAERALESERWAYRRAKQELKTVQDTDANEQRRLALEVRVAELEAECKDQAARIDMGQERERMLANTLRAVEARLVDAQNQLLARQQQPIVRSLVEEEEEERLGAVDRQMIEERRRARLADEQLKLAMEELERERNEKRVLATRVQELEDQRKRKRVDEEAVVSAGEAARNRRMKVGGSPFSTPPVRRRQSEGVRATVDTWSPRRSPVAKPVTPKINLQTHTTPPVRGHRASLLSQFLQAT